MFTIALLIILAFVYFGAEAQYKKTEYYKQTKNTYYGVHFNKGLSGEYRIYKYLNSLEGTKRYLFNLYLPKDDGGTTEIDVVFLHDSGMYVFESKNYSGWIFGTETQKNWTQTLPMGPGKSQKIHFYNPIMQNRSHIKWLQSYLHNDNLPTYSCIVFSERCELKDINITSGEHTVINRNHVLEAVRWHSGIQGTRFSLDQIDDIYNKLYPLTQVDFHVKQEHIENMQSLKNVVKTTHNNNSENLPNQPRFCPQCGGKLKIRTASKGKYQGMKFYGCSNYPKCKYTKNVTE